MMHSDQGHQATDRTITLYQECFCWNSRYKDIVKYVYNHSQCQIVNRQYIGPHIQPGSLVANNPLDLLCVDFAKTTLWRTKCPHPDGCISKFSWAFVTPNQNAYTIAEVLMDKWFYVYEILACIHSDKVCCFEYEVMDYLHSMYGIKGLTITPYNLFGNSQCERFNYTPHDLHKTFIKKQKKVGLCICQLLLSLIMQCLIVPLGSNPMN